MFSRIFSPKFIYIPSLILLFSSLIFTSTETTENYNSKNFDLFVNESSKSELTLVKPKYNKFTKTTDYIVLRKDLPITRHVEVSVLEEEKDSFSKVYSEQGVKFSLEESFILNVKTSPKYYLFILFLFSSLMLLLSFVHKKETIDDNVAYFEPKIQFIFNKKIYLSLAVILFVTTSCFYGLMSKTVYDQTSFQNFLKFSDPAQLVLNSPIENPTERTTSFVLSQKNKPYFFDKTFLIIPTEQVDVFLNSLSKAGIKIDLKSSILHRAYRAPAPFCIILCSLSIILFFVSLIVENEISSRAKYSNIGNPDSGSGSENKSDAVLKKLSFNDVAGIDEVKEQIEEVVQLFRDSSKIEEMGGRIPRGVLLNGPPGTGKTLLAKVTACESNANFIHASGSEFVEMYVGVGAKRVRELFNKARQQAPCIIFIDEIDAVAGKRGLDNNSEREQTLNELLVQMDGFSSKENILVFAATNQLEKLDSAILRPGRFDRLISVFLPDAKGREKILKIYLDKTRVKSVKTKQLARSTSGFSGADLSNLVNEAILYAARNGKDSICQKDLIWAKDKILMGSERKLSLNTDDLKKTAFHEIGHAFLCKKFNLGKIVNVSIVPRGKALGVTQMESQDTYTISRDRAVDQIAMMMGGRACEKVFFDHYSTGASNDLQRAYNLARSMVAHWGMSEIGPFGLEESFYKIISEATKSKIEDESLRIVSMAEKRATDMIMENKALVEALSLSLFEREVMSEKDMDLIEQKFFNSKKVGS